MLQSTMKLIVSKKLGAWDHTKFEEESSYMFACNLTQVNTYITVLTVHG